MTITMTSEFKAAAKKDIEGIKARWMSAAMIQDEEMRDAAIADYKAYVDMWAKFGISIALFD